MPKMKTHQGTKKRFRLTKNGKLMRMKQGRGHLRRKKRSNQNSDYRHTISSDNKTAKKLVKQVAPSDS